MNLVENWDMIQSVFNQGIASSKHCAIASISKDGHPHITPIGFTFLRSNQTAFYFEEHPKNLPQNLQAHPDVCLMCVNSGLGFWLSSLLKGRFATYPGIRLYGTVGELRIATAEEQHLLRKRIGMTAYLPGAKLIWSDLQHVRDIQITAAEMVRYPKMMGHLTAHL